MSDLISRQEAIDAVMKLPAWHGSEGSWYDSYDIKKALEGLPSTEPEQKKGKWISVDSYSAYGGDEEAWLSHGNPIAFYYCSECKNQSFVDEWGEDILSNFCPYCGADMRREEWKK